MRLRDARQAYYELSGQVSLNVRQFALAGVAVIWIFKIQSEAGDLALPGTLKWSAVFIFLSLALDFCQYLYATMAWGCFHRRKEIELKNDEDQEFHAPSAINLPTTVFFFSKVLCVLLAYGILIEFVISKVGSVK